MPRRVAVYTRDQDGGTDLWFECPGCGLNHRACAARWNWNGDVEKPTFNPSVLVRWDDETGAKRCHFFVREGRIEFCADSTHELAGKTVDLPEIADSF